MKKLALALALLGAFLSCSSPDADARTDPGTAQAGNDFFPVAQVIVDRCATIDCHGSKYRNMRLYGYGSERFDP